MDIVPLVDEGLGNSAYVVDLGDGGALVVDPERDPRPYLAELERRELTARFVLETPLRADFVSGGRELAARGARLLAPVGSELSYAHQPLRDGAELELGRLTLDNRAGPRVHGPTPPPLPPLDLEAFDAVVAEGAEVVDVRQIGRFAAGHVLAGGPGDLGELETGAEA
jgi:hydroxyacylglutathione hydrolase